MLNNPAVDAVAELPPGVADAGTRVVMLDRAGAVLYTSRPKSGLQGLLVKGESSPQPSNLGSGEERRGPPVSVEVVRQYRSDNSHHATCLGTKTDAIAGLGFDREEGAPREPHPLDSLCLEPFVESVLRPSVADLVQFGHGHIEVVSKGTKASGLYHIRAGTLGVHVENNAGDWHYYASTDQGAEKRLARFGDKDRLVKKYKLDPDQTSEVIRFVHNRDVDPYFGYPDWIAAVPAIEIITLLHQYKADFYLNRCVPEFMLFITGSNVQKDDWAVIQKNLKAHLGSGNAHKTLALNIPGKDVKVQVEKLAIMESGDPDFEPTKNVLSTDIVTAHRVPPHLAGILIPGKLGASNELTNALLAFHILYVGPRQESVEATLEQTLGKSVPGASGKMKLRSLKDAMMKQLISPEATALNTVGGMRQGVAEASADGRKLTDGLKKGERASWASVLSALSMVARGAEDNAAS